MISRSSRQAERGKDARNVGFLWKTKLGWGRIQRINHIARDEPVTYSTLGSRRSSILAVKPIPDGYATVTPYLYVRDAARAIDFYAKAFGAIEIYRLANPGGKIGQAEILIGTSRIMLADEFPEMNVKGPQSLEGTSVSFLIYVEDVDARFDRAIAPGATVLRPLKDQFYGDRSGTLADPFGHSWTIATHVEDVLPEEMQARFEAAMRSPGDA